MTRFLRLRSGKNRGKCTQFLLIADVDDYPEIERPTAVTVARRAIILSVVSCRAFTSKAPKDPEAASLAKGSFDWLRAIGLDEDLTEWENRVLTTAFGMLPERDIINASWLSEAVTVLSWALGQMDLPAFDKQCDPPDAANSLGFLEPTDGTALHKPILRSNDELDDYNDFIYNLNWRLRDFSRHKQPYDCSNLLGEYDGQYGFKLAGLDVCIDGVPITAADESTLNSVMSVTRERHRASNWLSGHDSVDFYSVGTDT